MNTRAQSAGFLPYPVRMQLNQIDPRLDLYWQQTLAGQFATISRSEQESAIDQILKPKSILWDMESGHFVYLNTHPRFAEYAASVQHPGLKALAVKISDTLNALAQSDDILKITTTFEKIIESIRSADLGGKLEWQAVKRELFAEFVYAAARLVQSRKTLTIPPNCRNLSADMIKVFVCEVYLKQQLLGYWYRTLRPRDLAAMKQPLFHELAEEQKRRQFEVALTSKYLFVIAPVYNGSANPFSLQRFLAEDSLFAGGHIYLNGAVIETAQAHKPEYAKVFKMQLDRIVTLDTTVRKAVSDLMGELENSYDNQIIPALFAPLSDAQAVPQRLREFELKLTSSILEPLGAGLLKTAGTEDEFQYMYVSTNQLFAGILRTFQEFQTQPAAKGSQEAELLSGRLLAYMALLGKRRGEVFVELTPEQLSTQNRLVREPLEALHEIVQRYLDEAENLSEQIENKQGHMQEKPSFFAKLTKQNEHLQDQIGQLKKQAASIATKAFTEINQTVYRPNSCIVQLELETVYSGNGHSRHCAFAAGNNGMTRLPAVVALPEDVRSFDLIAFNDSLE